MAWYRCGMNGTYNATTVSRSGAICNYIANVGGVPLSRFIANITPIQEGSGDPSPINQRPITGWTSVSVARTGKNLFNPIAYSNFLQPDGKYRGHASDINSVKTYLGAYIGKQMTFSSYIDLTVSPSPTYIRCVANINGALIRGNTITSGNAGYTSVTFTPQSANDYIVITYGSGGDNSFTFYNVQLELGSTATTYAPYTGQTATINLDGTYYGGTLNVGTGVLTVTHEIIDLGDINYTYDSTYTRMYGLLPNAKALLARRMKLVCSCFTVIDDGRPVSDVPNNACYNGNAGESTYIYIKEDSTTDTNAFKTSVTGQKLVYELATPQTYQLTPAQITQLLGENNVWADSGDSEVDFFKIIRT